MIAYVSAETMSANASGLSAEEMETPVFDGQVGGEPERNADADRGVAEKDALWLLAGVRPHHDVLVVHDRVEHDRHTEHERRIVLRRGREQGIADDRHDRRAV